MVTQKQANAISEVCSLLYQASKSVRILTTISWPRQVRHEFFRQKAKALPVVTYPEFVPGDLFELLAQARRKAQGLPFEPWLVKQADVLEASAKMLDSVGRRAFFTQSLALYGAPTGKLLDGKTTTLALATQFDQHLQSMSHLDLGAPPDSCYLAEYVAKRMRKAAKSLFGKKAPPVVVVEDLSSNALAGPGRICIRKGACFSERDIDQLINHEAFIHVATSLNGQNQEDMKILAAGHPGTTKTQEGLAVFAEFITGSMDLDRMRRLADRVLAIQMAIDGADFLQVYQFFCERTGDEGQAFENARRVFRGGVLTGGAPFTKDLVYLDGLLRVHNFLRTAVAMGRADCIRLLFCGKLDLEDISVFCQLANLGICREPAFLPPWASDLRFLLSYLSYSSFLNAIDLGPIKRHYQDLLAHSPPAQPLPDLN